MAKATTKKPKAEDVMAATLKEIARLGGRQGALASDALKAAGK